MKVGVVGVQGAVSEHISMLEKTFKKLEVNGEAVWVRKREQLEEVSALIIPGGESTTISKLMVRNGLLEEVKKKAEKGLPIMGTCAGLILMAKKVEGAVKDQKFLEILDVAVLRNAYGRQVDSFEADLLLAFSDKPFPGVFIRAPRILEVFGKAKAIAWHGKEVVGVERENLIGLAFHPELTTDTRIHEYFVKKIA